MTDPVEIAHAGAVAVHGMNIGYDEIKGGIAALEAAGYRILGPEPIREVLMAGYRARKADRGIEDVLRAMLAAAPRYGE